MSASTLNSGEFKARMMAMASSVPGSVSMITRRGDCGKATVETAIAATMSERVRSFTEEFLSGGQPICKGVGLSTKEYFNVCLGALTRVVLVRLINCEDLISWNVLKPLPDATGPMNLD